MIIEEQRGRVKEKYKDDNTGIGRHFKGEMPADWMDEER